MVVCRDQYLQCIRWCRLILLICVRQKSIGFAVQKVSCIFVLLYHLQINWRYYWRYIYTRIKAKLALITFYSSACHGQLRGSINQMCPIAASDVTSPGSYNTPSYFATY